MGGLKTNKNGLIVGFNSTAPRKPSAAQQAQPDINAINQAHAESIARQNQQNYSFADQARKEAEQYFKQKNLMGSTKPPVMPKPQAPAEGEGQYFQYRSINGPDIGSELPKFSGPPTKKRMMEETAVAANMLNQGTGGTGANLNQFSAPDLTGLQFGGT